MNRIKTLALLGAFALLQGTASAGSLVWSDTSNALRTANTDGTGYRTLVANDRNDGGIGDVVADSNGQQVYWTSNSGGLQRIGLDGSGRVTLIADNPAPDNNIARVALDLPRGHIYYSQFNSSAPGGRYSISRINLDGSNRVSIFEGLNSVFGLAVDSINSRLYYGDSTDFSGALGTYFLRSTNLDGSNGQTLLTSLNAVQDLEVDPVGGSLYLNDLGLVIRASLDGSNAQTLPNVGYRGIAIEPATALYGTNSGIFRVDQDGSNFAYLPGLENLGGNIPLGIAFVGPRVAAVPEPSTLALAGLGMLGTAGLAWKRRTRA